MSNEQPQQKSPSHPSQSFVMVCVTEQNYRNSTHKPEFHRVTFNRPDLNTMLFSIRQPKQKPEPNMKRISCAQSNIAAIDESNHLWFHSMDLSISETPINLSKFLLRKIYRIAMTAQELIVQSKEAGYVISWGDQPRYDREFKYIQTSKAPPTTTPLRFQQLECTINNSKFYYSNDSSEKKAHYPVEITNDKLKSFHPNSATISCSFRIKGISMSKYHNLCWDHDGKIYSWGHRSVGLGYFQNLQDKEVLSPRQITELDDQFIVSAHCTTNYSIAVTTSGEFFEWGIVRKKPQGQEEVLYSPTKVEQIKEDPKCICFKAKDSLCAMITNKYELYMWGSGSDLFTNTQESFRTPIKVNLPQKVSVIDFDFGRGFIAIIGTDNPNQWPSEYATSHKISQLESIKSKLRRQRTTTQNNKKDCDIIPRMSTDLSANFRSSKKKNHSRTKLKTYESVLKDQENHFDCHKEVTRKKQYFDLQANESKMLQFIFSSTNIQKFKCLRHLRIEDNLQNDRAILSQIQTRKVNLIQNLNDTIRTIRQLSFNSTQRSNEFIKAKEKQFSTFQKLSKKSQTKYEQQNSISPQKYLPLKTHFSTTMFSERQKIVKLKREDYHRDKRERILANAFKHSEQYRRKVKQQQQRAFMIKQRSSGIMKIKAVLVQQYLCRIILRPIIQARIFLIEDFSKKLRYERCIRTIQLRYHEKRLENRVNRLTPRQFFLLQRYVNRFVKRFRQRRRRLYVGTLEKAVIKSKVKDKMLFMIKMLEFTVKKLRKLSLWCKMVKVYKLKSMAYRWNLFLANNTVLQIKNLPQELVQFRSKQYEQMSTSVIYKGLLFTKPQLNLKQFVVKHPIFRINLEFLKSLPITIKCKQKAEQNLNANEPRTRKVMFVPRKLSTQVINLDKLSILPFSRDYQIVIFPPAFQLRISQRVLNESRWICVEKQILKELLTAHLTKKQQNHRRALKAYDLEMAQFIKKNYQELCNRRAKYIITYNSLKPDERKNRIMKEMVRILKKAGLLDLLKEDYLPQKHDLLEEAHTLNSCPVKPVLGDLLPKEEFKELFNQYYARMQSAANPRSKLNLKGPTSPSK